MGKKHFYKLSVLVVSILILFISTAKMAFASTEEKPVAEVMMGASGITWVPKVTFAQLVLTLSRPDGTIIQRIFPSGTSPYADLSNICGEEVNDGSYTYELKVVPFLEKRTPRKGDSEIENNGRKQTTKTISQTGYFVIRNGMIIVPGSESEDGLSKAMDVVHLDDVIIDGSLCVGNDCSDGYDFGFDTIALRENNLRIFFDDTSSIQNYPRNDWRLIANDSTDGGGNYFAIQDATDISNILVMEAGAPSNSIYVDNYGDVGINTSTPYYELHIVDGDSPAIRLEQDGSYGWPVQKWDLCGNESNFFIRDATHASKLPFRIEPDAPSNSIFVKSTGRVGIGTGAPAYPLELETSGVNAEFVTQRTDGATCYISGGLSRGFFGTKTNHPLRLTVNDSYQMEITSGSNINMADGGGYNGTWNPASSRELKENIEDLSTDQAMEALSGLTPVTFNYKKDKEDPRVGFIAEDVPELVAMKNRKSLGTVDIIAVLTKVLQEQQKQLDEQKKHDQEQQTIISNLLKRISELENK